MKSIFTRCRWCLLIVVSMMQPACKHKQADALPLSQYFYCGKNGVTVMIMV